MAHWQDLVIAYDIACGLTTNLSDHYQVRKERHLGRRLHVDSELSHWPAAPYFDRSFDPLISCACLVDISLNISLRSENQLGQPGWLGRRTNSKLLQCPPYYIALPAIHLILSTLLSTATPRCTYSTPGSREQAPKSGTTPQTRVK